MSLSLRKEQVLALAVLAIAAYVYSQREDAAGGRSVYNPGALDLAVAPVVPAPLVEGAAAAGGRRDLFTQPRETRPLPPRSLDFPPRAPGTVVALPLTIGPGYRDLVRLAIDGSVVEGVTLQEGNGDNGSAAAAPAASQDPPDRAALLAQAAKTYDRITLVGQNAPLYGIVEVYKADGTAVDPYDAEKLTDFSSHEVRLRRYDPGTGKLGSLMKVRPGDTQQVAKVELADNLRNDVERRKRAIIEDYAHLGERGHLIEWLLEQARDEIWVYGEATAQADLYYQISKGNLDGLRWRLRVLRARGDLAGELALLEGIEGRHRETVFRYEGLGRLQARLGLTLDAEKNLRRAAELGPQDASPHAALAEFLLEQGENREAAASARRAGRAFGSLLDDGDKARVVRVLVACHLAIGDIEGAKNARARISSSIAPRYLDGAIAYAAGDVEAALATFQSAGAELTGGRAARDEARLGEAASLLRLQRWQEAHDAFLTVYDDAPLLRHRAACGMSLLQQRLGAVESALAWADRAIEADPQFAYAYYLRGRALRTAGQFRPATEAQGIALKGHDDFVHAIVEMARLFGLQADGAFGQEQARLALDAMRYSDRAVELSPLRLAELYEFQGLQHMAAADRRGAMTAFADARDAAGSDQEKLFARGALAVVDYSLGRVDDAVAVLQRLIEDLGKDDPVRQWAEATVIAIDDHSQKEMLEDRFEREDVGSIWLTESDGGLRAKVLDGRLVFDGKFTISGRGEVWAERAGAVQKGKNFLAVACQLQLGAGQPRNSGFAGLRLQTQEGANGRVDFRVELGVREGAPYLVVVDNRQDPERPQIEIANFTVTGKQNLELRVLPQAKDQGRTFVLQVSWNDQIVYQQELKSLSGTTQTELKTVLFASGNKGAAVDVAFDDYRLERKKER